MSAITCIGLLVVFTCELPPAPPPTPPVVICPVVPAWSRDFQGRLADGIAALPPGSAIAQALREHIHLRDKLRTCRK